MDKDKPKKHSPVEESIYNLIDNVIKNKDNNSKLIFFNYFDSLNNKDVLFDKLFKIKKSFPSKSANGFISVICFKYPGDNLTTFKEEDFENTEFILKTPKTSSGDDPVKEYNISKSLTIFCVKNKFDNFIARTWASVNCVPNYINPRTPNEALGENEACLKKSFKQKRTHIIMDKINGETFKHYFNKIPKKEVYNILTILLCNIYILREKTGFTHYDLHYDNVMLEELEKEQEFVYNIGKVEVVVKSKYYPVIIDFGRTFIRPGLVKGYNTRIFPGFYSESKEGREYTAKEILNNYIKSVSTKKNIPSIIEDILNKFYLLKLKSPCDYTREEQKIIIAVSFIKGYTEYYNISISDSDEKSFVEYITKDICSKCDINITSHKENNIVDFLRISSYVFYYTGDGHLSDIIRSNYPYILDSYYLPIDKIKNNKTGGIFCLNDEIDMIHFINNNSVKNYTYTYKGDDFNVLNPVFPDEKNKKIVKNILSSKKSKLFFLF